MAAVFRLGAVAERKIGENVGTTTELFYASRMWELLHSAKDRLFDRTAWELLQRSFFVEPISFAGTHLK
ncbi:hypothetical protein LEP1GSC052_1996 [Leptospira kmetyi serovar Malaysia str. Bejo-Iso9]|nr:hypothetical protein LEP1GSC052_1996 [Leptospira kmetyi serovar Malaysia str. Bejo-Iso9]